jgi:hypothetical protein
MKQSNEERQHFLHIQKHKLNILLLFIVNIKVIIKVGQKTKRRIEKRERNRDRL